MHAVDLTIYARLFTELENVVKMNEIQSSKCKRNALNLS